MITVGRCSSASCATASKSICWVSLQRPYWIAWNHFPDMLGARAVREVATGVEAHAENGVARFRQRQQHALIGLAAGVRLDVGIGTPEQLPGAIDRELLDDIDVLASAVVAASGIAFRVFVGQHRAGRIEHGPAHDVLGRDQFDLIALTLKFRVHGTRDRRVGLPDLVGEKAFANAIFGLNNSQIRFHGRFPPIGLASLARLRRKQRILVQATVDQGDGFVDRVVLNADLAPDQLDQLVDAFDGRHAVGQRARGR